MIKCNLRQGLSSYKLLETSYFQNHRQELQNSEGNAEGDGRRGGRSKEEVLEGDTISAQIICLDKTFFRWRFHDLAHFHSRTEHFLSARTVRPPGGPFVTGHHHEDDTSDQSN